MGEESKKYLQRLYSFKSISDKQFIDSVKYLEKLRAQDLFYYYFNMGKLNCLYGDSYSALFYLEKALMLNPKSANCYYNMYKCHVKNRDFDKAYDSFCDFIYFNEVEGDFSFPVDLLQTIRFLDNNFSAYVQCNVGVKKSNMLCFNDLSDNDELNILYGEVIEAYNKRNYVVVLSKLHQMESVINQLNYPMEVDTLIKLVDVIKEKAMVQHMSVINDKLRFGDDDVAYCNYCLRLFELGKYFQDTFLRKIEEIIEDGSFSRAERLLESVGLKKEFNEYHDMIDYLKGILGEKREFFNLNVLQQKQFDSKILKANDLYNKNKLDEALKIYNELKNEYGLNVCDYYIGKSLLKKGEYEQSKSAFFRYLKQGGTKAENAYIYLSKIETINKNKREARRYVLLSQKICSVFLRNFEYLPDKKYYDINVTEDYFEMCNRNTVLDFYDSSFGGKLSIVEGLYQNGNAQIADKLLKEIENVYMYEENNKISQFKKIYKN